MSRDPKRIKIMLALIEKIWEKDPDMRLYQLLGNCGLAPGSDHYYVDDRDLEAGLRSRYHVTK